MTLMAHKPTFASVTTEPCACNWPRDVSREPENSVRFDESTGEYEFITPSGGKLNIYHCPFCGGAMPRSRRAELFAYISDAEVQRLDELTATLGSVDEAVRVLGPADSDMAAGLRERTPPRGRRPPRVESYRVLTFTRLSDTADVQLIDCGSQGIRFSYVGKYLGTRKGPQNKKQGIRSRTGVRAAPEDHGCGCSVLDSAADIRLMDHSIKDRLGSWLRWSARRHDRSW